MSLNVIALGGNAILENDPSDEGQKEKVREAAAYIADFVSSGEKVAICHGNGPQVGNLLLQQKAGKTEKNPPLKLDTLVAMTEGSIGYWIQNALYNEFVSRDINQSVIAIVTQVSVDKEDVAFDNPTKPIGPFYTEEEAQEERNLDSQAVFKEDAGRGYRKYVPSPVPQSIIENAAVLKMIEADIIPIVAGGGGVPVIVEDNQIKGVEAVNDKDLAAKVLAEDIGADNLIILTAVDNIYINFNTPKQKALETLTVEEAEKYIDEEQFAAGSMLPKVQAAINFVKGHDNRKAIITSLSNLSRIHEGVGTIIIDKV